MGFLFFILFRMDYVYILFSEKIDRFYIGYTSNLDERLQFHKDPDPNKYTYNADDWVLFYKISCVSKQQALVIEKHIKRMKSTTYIRNLVKYPEMAIKLLEKYKNC